MEAESNLIVIDKTKEMTVRQYASKQGTTPNNVYMLIKRGDIQTRIIPELDDLILVQVDTLKESIAEKRRKKIQAILKSLDDDEIKKLREE